LIRLIRPIRHVLFFLDAGDGLAGLGEFPELGLTFKTTNAIESVMVRVEEKTARVDRWRTSDQKLRWCAAALLAIEPGFRRVKNHDQLRLLEKALQAKMTPLNRDAA
jgi:hypothetical protein